MAKVNRLIKLSKKSIDYSFGYRYADQVTGEVFTVKPFGYHAKSKKGKIDKSEIKWKQTFPVKRKEYLDWKKKQKNKKKAKLLK